MSEYFYGWYFRCQSEQGTVAVIPAVHISDKKRSCSLQVITEHGAWNQEFSIDQFRVDNKKLNMKIGENFFSAKGLSIRLSGNGYEIQGSLRFGDLTVPKYQIMGPFRYVPYMECRHAVYSMRHTVRGWISINGNYLNFENGLGYMEGDRGTSFPVKYIWTQHFLEKGQGSLVLAAAEVPLGPVRFTGTIGLVWWKGREYRFATYLGARVCRMKDEILIKQGAYQLKAKCLARHKKMLYAPSKGAMVRKIGENPSCEGEYTLIHKNEVILKCRTDRGAFEWEV